MRIKELGVFLTALFVTVVGYAADTTYDPATGTVTIPEVEIDGKVAFVNVKLERNSNGTFSVVSTEEPPVSKTDTTYDSASGTVTIPTLASTKGVIHYANFKLKENSNGTFSILSFEEPQVSDILYCSTYAAGTDYCVDGSFPTCRPVLARVNKLKLGMTYNEVVEIMGCHGTLVGRAVDQYGTQVSFYVWNDHLFNERVNFLPEYQTDVTFYDGSVRYINSLLSFYTSPSDLAYDSGEN